MMSHDGKSGRDERNQNDPVCDRYPGRAAVTVTTIQTAVRSAERNAILSSCCGVLGEVTLTDSAIILVFAGMLGAGEPFSLMATSLLPLVNGLCILPMAGVAARMGNRALATRASALAGAAFFAAVSAPWFGHAAVAVLLVSVFCFSLSLSGFVASWFPLLDTFLEEERRVAFLGRMRLCHLAASAVFLFAVGLLIGRRPQVGQLQAVLFVSAFIFLGRWAFLARIPVFSRKKGGPFSLRQGLSVAAGNRPLGGFARYVFALNLASYGVVPLALLYLKNQLHAPANVVVIVSAAALCGMLLGYAGTAGAVRGRESRGLFQMAHAAFVLVCLSLFCIGKGGVPVYVLMAALLLIHSFFIAATSVVSSSEMFSLANAGNKTVDMAFFGALFYGGQGLSRLIPSLLLGSHTAALRLPLGGIFVCRYQVIFLLAAAGVALAAFTLPKKQAARGVLPAAPEDVRAL